jgi:hypothetical protein
MEEKFKQNIFTKNLLQKENFKIQDSRMYQKDTIDSLKVKKEMKKF